MGLEIFQGARETGWDAFAVTGSAQIPGNSDDPDDDPVMIAHGQFRRQTPAGTAMGVPMQFKVIDDGAATADDRLVLVRVNFGKLFWKNLLNMPAEQFLFIAATTAFDERLIDGDVTAASVFDKKCGVGNVIEKLFDDG